MVGMMTQEERDARRVAEGPALSPEGEATLAWLLAEQRSVQEVDERLGLLPDEDRDQVEGELSASPVYGGAFMRHLSALTLRDMNRGNNIEAGSSRYRREAPAGYQRVLKEITRLRAVGRNVMALTPELLPEDLMRIWPPGRPLPELVVVNFDHPIPEVSLVRRLPSAGGLPLSRAELLYMTGLVRLVLGSPAALRGMAAAQGIALEHSFERVSVGLTEIAWSPHLELGELLYDSEEVRSSATDDAHLSRVSELQARQSDQRSVVRHLGERVNTLQAGWETEPANEGREAEARLAALDARLEVLRERGDRQRDRLGALAGTLMDEVQGHTDARIREAQGEIEAQEAEALEVAALVADEQRALDSHRAALAPDAQRRIDWDAPADEETDEDGKKKKARAKAEALDEGQKQAEESQGRES